MLWETNQHSSKDSVQRFVEEPKRLEQKLLPYDVIGNLAHVEMLESEGYMSEEEAEAAKRELKNIYNQEPKVESEDVHTFVEERVTEKTEAGKKIHTGRSRNDQVVLDTHLYMKEAAIETGLEIIELAEALEDFSKNHNQTVPGYTHQQQAMPSSTGLWASSFVDALVDDLRMLESVFDLIDKSPLGGAASYGTSLDIDREMTADLLGFKEVQQNPIYAVGGRGKKELMLLQSLNHVMLDMQKLSEDVINFSEDQQIFRIPDRFTTGSSIMPQKKNPDILEMVRAKAEEVNAAELATRGVIGKLPSGYNKDSQATKKHLFSGVQNTKESLEVLSSLIESLQLSENFSMNEDVFAAYTANRKVEEGASFRDAYTDTKEQQTYETFSETPAPKNQTYSEMAKSWKRKQREFEDTKERVLGL
jgi:Argininosuccinate lyase